MTKYINTDRGLLSDSKVLLAPDQYTDKEKIITSILPKMYRLLDTLYWRKDNESIVLFETNSWSMVVLSPEIFRFTMVFDKGAMQAKGGSCGANATIEGIKVSGYKHTKRMDTEYEFSTKHIIITLSGAILRTLEKIRGKVT